MYILKKPKILFLIFLFSPYIVKNVPPFRDIRFDHILLLIIGLYIIYAGKIYKSNEIVAFLVMFLVFFFSTTISFLRDEYPVSLQVIINTVEWYGRGVIIVVFIKYSDDGGDESEPTDLINTLVYSGVVVNLIGISMITPKVNAVILPVIDRFYSGTFGQDKSYVEMMTASKRMISILGQTGTAGLFALLNFTALLVFERRALKMSRIAYYSFFVLSLFGGILTLSKAFYFGLPLILLFYVVKHFGGKSFLKISVVVIVFAVFIFFVLPNLGLSRQFLYALAFVRKYTNLSFAEIYQQTFVPRFSSDSGALYNTVNVVKSNLILGVGLVISPNIRVIDSQWIPFLVFGGLCGIFCYLWYMTLVIGPIFKARKTIKNDIANGGALFNYFLFLLFVYLVFGIGSPTFSQDKTGDFFWIFVATLSRCYKTNGLLNTDKTVQLT